MYQGKSMDKKAEFFIEKLQLTPHPEGGYFNEIYRCKEKIKNNGLPVRYDSDKNVSTSIYFLLKGNQVSKFHRLKSDEIWHFYSGSALTVHLIFANGNYNTIKLGNNFESGEVFQAVIPAGVWFGAMVNDIDSYSLIGCTVAPGFDFTDFELANRNDMLGSFPEHRNIIEELT